MVDWEQCYPFVWTSNGTGEVNAQESKPGFSKPHHRRVRAIASPEPGYSVGCMQMDGYSQPQLIDGCLESSNWDDMTLSPIQEKDT